MNRLTDVNKAEILRLRDQGMTHKGIAERLLLKLPTVSAFLARERPCECGRSDQFGVGPGHWHCRPVGKTEPFGTLVDGGKNGESGGVPNA